MAFLVGVGILAASSRQRTELRRWLPAALALPTAIGGILYYQDSLTGLDPDQGHYFLMLIGPSALALPLAAWAIIALRSQAATPRRIALQIGLTTALLAVGWQFTIAIVLIGSLFARFLLFPMQYGQGADALPLVPGSVAVGLLLGYIAARRIAQPEPAPHTALGANPVIDIAHPPPAGPV